MSDVGDSALHHPTETSAASGSTSVALGTFYELWEAFGTLDKVVQNAAWIATAAVLLDTEKSPEASAGTTFPSPAAPVPLHQQSFFPAESNTSSNEEKETGDLATKPFFCADCGRSFAQKGTLINHRRTHTGEKPFVCGVCGRGFAQRCNLNRHQNTHTGQKPYVCVCKRSFARKSGLKLHQESCSGDSAAASPSVSVT